MHNAIVADSDRRVAAKLVDLDPEQQLVSMIWGLEVRVCTADGTTLLRGEFEPAAFMHIWDRARSGVGDILAGAEYQSGVELDRVVDPLARYSAPALRARFTAEVAATYWCP